MRQHQLISSVWCIFAALFVEKMPEEISRQTMFSTCPGWPRPRAATGRILFSL